MTAPQDSPAYTPTPDLSPVPPPPARRGIGLLAGVVVGVLILMAATGLGVWLAVKPDTKAPAAQPAASALEVTGMVTLKHEQFRWGGRADPTCMGWQGFDDVRGGAQVTVTDASGKVLVVGSLDTGTATGITTEANGLPRAELCLIPFKVTGIPRGAGPYGVEIAHRGILRYAEGNLGGLQLGF